MTEENKDEFGELSALARRLKGADLSTDSRVRDALRARLLARARRPTRQLPVYAWLLPAAAAAALFIIFGPRKTMESPVYGLSYSLQDDGYSECGRRGLGDYMADSRF